MIDVVSRASGHVDELFIDVRTDAEWNEGHKPGAMHFDLESMELGLLPTVPKHTRIALYCRTGARAARARDILVANHFSRVRCAGGLVDVMGRKK